MMGHACAATSGLASPPHSHVIFTRTVSANPQLQLTRSVSIASVHRLRGCSATANIEDLCIPQSSNAPHVGTSVSLEGHALLESATLLKKPNEASRLSIYDHTAKGLGIVEFLKHKNILVLGATGFLGGVLIEKILRVQPDVGQLFLLMKAKDKTSAEARLKQITNSELFSSLRRKHKERLEDFLATRITLLLGDVTLDNLGLEDDVIKYVCEILDIIVNSAATTTFDQRYDVALNINTLGAQRAVGLGKQCRRLQLLLHVSTAYVNGKRKGLVPEKTFCNGESIAQESTTCANGATQVLDIERELQIGMEAETLMMVGEDFPHQRTHTSLHKRMKQMGLARAELFGWQDTYVFTKAMGEMLISSMHGTIPVAIVRPSIIESSIAEPFGGWIQGIRMADPIVLMYGKGQVEGFPADPSNVLDVVPVDMVVNAMLAIMAQNVCKSQLEVYQVASSIANPLVIADVTKMWYHFFRENPLYGRDGNLVKVKPFQHFEDGNRFLLSVHDCIKKISKKTDCQDKLFMKAKEQLSNLTRIYQPYAFYEGRFDNVNTQRLYEKMSEIERTQFNFNVCGIDWSSYIIDIHLPGLRRHALNNHG